VSLAHLTTPADVAGVGGAHATDRALDDALGPVCRACGDPCDADAETCWRCDIHGTAPIPASYPSDRER